MVRFLYSWFSWVPVLGGIFKGLYIKDMIKRVSAQSSGWEPTGELSSDKEELDRELKNMAEELVDEGLAEMNVDLGMLQSMVKSGAIKAVVKQMRSKLVG